ncbi:hypothetical protein HY642_02870 [Candidatus Woesearchaeota archaeon]|nr:hypothetical protein [Candidatus Woesearchaeota archaeon]
MRTAIYALLLLALAGMLASASLADQLYAVAPSGKKYLIASCGEKETCEAHDIDKGFCDEEGQWKVRFEAQRYDTAGNKLGDHTKETNAHVVNWDTEEYCRAECVRQSAVEWSSVVGQCCGDDRNASSRQPSCGDSVSVGGVAVNGGVSGSTSAGVKLAIVYMQGGSKAGEDVITWQAFAASAGGSAPFPAGNLRAYTAPDQGGVAPAGTTGVRPNTAPSSESVTIKYTPKAPSFDGIQLVLSGSVGGTAVEKKSAVAELPQPYAGGQVTITFDMGASQSLENGGIVSCCSGVYDASISTFTLSVPKDCPSQASTGDCGMTGGNLMCGQTEVGNWEYIDRQKDAGKIYPFYCKGIAGPNGEEVEYVPVLAANTKFAVCGRMGIGSAASTQTTGAAGAVGVGGVPFDFVFASSKGLTHQYACITNNGVPSIAECADNQTVLATGSGALPIYEGTLTLPAGVNAVTGQNLSDVFGKGKKTFYCSSNAKWIDGLDGDEAACIGAGFKWTGKHCCGEQPAEFYNDPWDGVSLNGGCWNSKHVARGAFANATTTDGRTKAVLNVNGVFNGCVLAGGDPLLALKDKFAPDLLVKNQAYCKNFPNVSQGKSFYCDSNGIWAADATGNRSRLSRIAWEPENESEKTFECCGASDCWNGGKCVTNQRGDATPTTTHDFRCINGDWVMQDLKFNWDRSKFGYCERNDQCLVDPQGSYDSNDKPQAFFNASVKPPQCIASGQYILDAYCEHGNWSSRTKQIAVQMLDFASENSPNDYRLFCDSAPDTLNTLVFNTQFGAVSNFITNCTLPGGKLGPCVNNFCVLAYGSEVAFGTSLNVPVNDRQSYLRALDKPETACNGAIDNDQNYNACDPRTWYDHATRSVITFHPGTGTLTTPGPDIEQRYILSPHDQIVNFVLRALHMKPNNYSFYANPKLFTNLYSTKMTGFEAFAFLEEGQFDGAVKRDYIGIQGPVQFNVCELVKHFDPLSECNSTATTYVVTERSDVSTKLITVWKDLTAKLRPESTRVVTNQTA